MTPFRDDMAALRARVELLETAARDRSCEACAARQARARRRPVLRILLAGVLGLAVLAVALSCVVAVGESLKHPF